MMEKSRNKSAEKVCHDGEYEELPSTKREIFKTLKQSILN
jgi:hypothetical protein